ncbi:MAG: LiaF-related protein [Bacteroidota bacterium]|nr:LiaF-related protein [Bacteroidota bacterium]
MKKIVFGTIVILAGLFLLAFNFNIIPETIGNVDVKHVVFSWQMLLIMLGIISLSSKERKTPGWILLMIGVFFIIPEIFTYHVSFINIFWPLLLIGIGIIILSNREFHDHWKTRFHQNSVLEEGFLNEANIFSGSKHKIINQVFKGGKISNIFGGTEIDLTHATLGEGQNELAIECIFGGVTLFVPSDWKVVLNVSAVMGGFSDKRYVIKEPSDPSRVLLIKGSAIFGGGEIKN